MAHIRKKRPVKENAAERMPFFSAACFLGRTEYVCVTVTGANAAVGR